MFLRSSINTHAPLYRIIISPLLLIFFYLFWGPPTVLISWQHMGGISSWGLIVAAQCLSHVSLHRPSRLLRNIAAGPSHPLPETHTNTRARKHNKERYNSNYKDKKESVTQSCMVKTQLSFPSRDNFFVLVEGSCVDAKVSTGQVFGIEKVFLQSRSSLIC